MRTGPCLTRDVTFTGLRGHGRKQVPGQFGLEGLPPVGGASGSVASLPGEADGSGDFAAGFAAAPCAGVGVDEDPLLLASSAGGFASAGDGVTGAGSSSSSSLTS